LRNIIEKENPFAIALDEEVKKEYSKIKSRVDRLHHSTQVFYSTFPALHLPHLNTSGQIPRRRSEEVYQRLGSRILIGMVMVVTGGKRMIGWQSMGKR
jgi:hypothetical protein